MPHLNALARIRSIDLSNPPHAAEVGSVQNSGQIGVSIASRPPLWIPSVTNQSPGLLVHVARISACGVHSMVQVPRGPAVASLVKLKLCMERAKTLATSVREVSGKKKLKLSLSLPLSLRTVELACVTMDSAVAMSWEMSWEPVQVGSM